MTPHRFISILGISCGVLIVTYLSLLGSTVYFAARQGELADALHSADASVSTLESTYLARVKSVTSGAMIEADFALPSRVHYAQAPFPGLSQASR
jgi:hypothetical protein